MNAENNTSEKSAQKGVDWKHIGRFVAIMVKMFSHVIEVFKKIGTGPEILDWITGNGKEVFEKEFLTPLAIRFGPTKDRFLTVDLDAAPDPRCNESRNVSIRRHHRFGTVLLERRGDDLYADGKRLGLYFSPRQKSEHKITIEDIDEELRGRKLPNVNILYALFDNEHMVPKTWEKFGAIYCLGTLFTSSWTDNRNHRRESTHARLFLWWPGEEEKYWTIDTACFHHPAGQHPVLIFEE